MTLKVDKNPLQTRRQQALAEKRAAALKANLKKRKEQINARATNNQTDKQDETI